jgi:hypothetical protein
MSCCEAIITRMPHILTREQSARKILAADIFGLSRTGTIKPWTDLRELADHIAEYTSRNLAYQDDALNAFRGLLGRSHFYSYFGPPLAVSDLPGLLKQHQDWSIGFARGLYWTPHCLGGVGTRGRWASLSRRPAFPSWLG